MERHNAEGEQKLQFFPVVSPTSEELLEAVLSEPFSHVSTEGPLWRTAAQRDRFRDDPGRSSIAVCAPADTIGAVTWRPGHTPGFLRLDIVSNDDAAWHAATVAAAVERAMDHITRTSHVRRVELLFGAYNEPLLEYVTSERGRFDVEGILRDRFFIDGRHWPGVLCSADMELFRPARREPDEHREELMRRLHEKTIEDLTSKGLGAAREAPSDPDGGL